MTFSQVQNGPTATGTGSVATTLSSASTAGNLLTATVFSPSGGTPFTAPSGWRQAASSGGASMLFGVNMNAYAAVAADVSGINEGIMYSGKTTGTNGVPAAWPGAEQGSFPGGTFAQEVQWTPDVSTTMAGTNDARILTFLSGAPSGSYVRPFHEANLGSNISLFGLTASNIPQLDTYLIALKNRNYPSLQYTRGFATSPVRGGQNISNWVAQTWTFTSTHASPAVFTVTGLNPSGGITPPNGTPVVLSGGSVPGGFTAGTTYYVVSKSGATFELAATIGGSGINSTGTGSGTVTTRLDGYSMDGYQASNASMTPAKCFGSTLAYIQGNSPAGIPVSIVETNTALNTTENNPSLWIQAVYDWAVSNGLSAIQSYWGPEAQCQEWSSSFKTAFNTVSAQCASSGGTEDAEIWYYPDNPGGISSVVFSNSAGANCRGSMDEWSTSAGSTQALNAQGDNSGSAATTSLPVSTGDPSASGDLGIAAFGSDFSVSTTGTWTTPSGWTLRRSLASGISNCYASYYKTGLTAAVQSVTGVFSTSANQNGWGAVVATFSQVTSISVTTTSCPAGTVGTAYTTTLAETGGELPVSWSVSSGSLPGGLTLSSDGIISGTPTASGTFSFTVEVQDAASNTATKSLSIVINPAEGPPPYITLIGQAGTSSTSTSLVMNVAASIGNGANIVVGVAVNTASITPSVTDSQGNPYTGVVDDTTETGEQIWTFESPSSAALTSGTDTLTIAVTGGTTAVVAIAMGVDNVGIAGHDKAVVAHGSSTLPTAASGTLSQAEEICIGFIADANAGGNPTWGGSWTGITNEPDGGSHMILSAGAQLVTATTSVSTSGTIASAAWTAGILTYAVQPPASSFMMSDGVVGDPYVQAGEGTGGIGEYAWTLTGSLPPGLTLESIGVISGTPTTAGIYSFSLTVTDSEGVSVTLPQTVTILASGPSVATTQPIAGNILQLSDSDFEYNPLDIEANAFSWAPLVNAQPPTYGSTSLTGSSSCLWQSVADGATSIATQLYPCTAGLPYILSGYLLTTSQQAPNLEIGAIWYDSGGDQLGVSSNSVTASAPLAWQGVTLAAVAPPGAVQFSMFANVDQSNLGDGNYLDLCFAAQSDVQILIDFVNPPYGASAIAGNNFSDVSPWLRLDQAINIQRGRQDAISEISTGQAYFVLQNDGGWFTQDSASSVAVALGGQVTLGARCQVNLSDENGAWYTRFDGPMSQILYAIDPTGNTNIATLYASDVFAPLSRQASPAYPGSHNYYAGPLSSLECWTKEQVIANGPQWHWSLDDQPNPTGELYLIAAETSGNNGPPLKLVRSASSAGSSIAWNDTTGGVETLADTFAPGEPDGSEYWPAGSNVPSGALRGLDAGTVGPFTTPMPSVYFTPALSAASAPNAFVSNTGYMLQALLPEPLAPSSTPGGDFAVEAWFTMDPEIVAKVTDDYGPYTVFSLGSSRRGTSVLVAGVFQPTSGNIPAGGAALYAGVPAYGNLNFAAAPPMAPGESAYNVDAFPEADTIQRPHHLVVSVQGDPVEPLGTVYVDGNIIGTIPFPAGTTFDTIAVGGAFGKTGCFFGNISMVSIYPFQLSPAQVTLDCQLGQYGMWEAPTDDCIAQLVEYANLPPFWNAISAQHDGLSLTDYFDITGNSPYDAMTTFEQTENGLLFVNAAGQLSFHTRDWRMGYGAPKLALPPDSYSADLSPSVLDSYQNNENAVASVAFPGGATFVNQASQDQYGTYATNPVGSPVQLAHISYSRGYGGAGLQEQSFWPDPNMEDAAAWQANSFSTPWYVLGGVIVDMLTVDPTWSVNVSDFYSVEIDDLLSLAGVLPDSLPSDSHANEYFIEGIAEVYQIDLSGNSQRTITYYVSPAETQRGWIPGDSNYGVLSQTTRLGISQTDLSTPQADGKDVSHDGGPPYWAPDFSSDMNSPANGTGFVGMNDMRGLTWPLQQLLQPPMATTQAVNNTQSISTGSQADPQVLWDTLSSDSANSVGAMPGWPNWYVCLVPGFYEIDAGVHYAAGTSGGAGIQGWIVVALNAAQGVVTQSSQPVSAGAYVCPIGSTVRENSVGMNAVTAPTTRLYLGLGDMVTIATEHDYGSSLSTSDTDGGSSMSVRFVGLGTADDRVQVNASINGGGVVTPPPPSHGTKTYSNQHTYAHYGPGASRGQWQLTPSGYDTDCYVGFWNSNYDTVGMQFTLIRFPWGQMQTDLAGKTLTSVTLTGTNQKTTYATNALLPGGYYYTDGEAGTWESSKQSPPANRGLWGEWFDKGKTRTFPLSAAQFQQYFVLDVAHGIILGTDAKTEKVGARYLGGPGSWTLTVSY